MATPSSKKLEAKIHFDSIQIPKAPSSSPGGGSSVSPMRTNKIYLIKHKKKVNEVDLEMVQGKTMKTNSPQLISDEQR